MKRLAALFLLLLVAIVIFWRGSPPSRDALTVAVTTDMKGLSPLLAFNVTGVMMQRHVYDSLVHFGPDGKINPRLAVSWELLDDKTWRFHLREGVKFHNGYAFTAADVKFTLEWLLDARNRWNFGSYFASYDKIEVVDSYTLDIKTKIPDPLLPNVLAAFVGIVSKQTFEENEKQGVRHHGVGTGPFELASWEPNDRLTLTAFSDWYLPPPRVKTLVFRIIPEMGTRVAELQTGGVDIITDVPPFMVATLEADDEIGVQSVESLRAMHIIMDSTKVAALRDKRVRQALNYAVDKEAIVEGVLGGMGTPLGTHVPLRIAERSGPLIEPYPYDLQKARALLKEAGYPNGFPLNLYTPNGRYPMDRQVTLAVADQLSKAGIDTKVHVMESGTYISKLIGRDFEGIYLIGMASRDWDISHSLNELDPSSLLCFHPDQALWEMVKKTKATMDTRKRSDAAYEIGNIVHDDAIYLFLYNVKGIYAVSRKVVGFRAPSDEMMDLWTVSVTQ